MGASETSGTPARTVPEVLSLTDAGVGPRTRRPKCRAACCPFDAALDERDQAPVAAAMKRQTIYAVAAQ